MAAPGTCTGEIHCSEMLMKYLLELVENDMLRVAKLSAMKHMQKKASNARLGLASEFLARAYGPTGYDWPLPVGHPLST